MIAFLRLGLAFLLFGLNMLVAGPLLYLMIYLDRIMGVGALQHQQKAEDWYIYWSWFVFSWARHVLGITLDIDIPESIWADLQPYFFVSNHSSVFDVLVVNWLMYKNRRHVQWVSKDGNRRVPFLGRALEEAGGCFIGRTGGLAEFRKLLRFATAMRAIGRDVYAFPEGTRFKGTVLGGMFKWLLDPHVFVFSACHRGFEDRPVIWLLIHWKTRGNHRTIFGTGIVGAKLTIRAGIVAPFDRKQAADVLIAIWTKMEAIIDELEKAA
jgi:1-acyl-sn-glycerol-3-phosphate acyltransferase